MQLAPLQVGQIQENMNNMKVGDNVDLLSQLRDNIMTITEVGRCTLTPPDP
jgi:hypothetical protein